MWPQKSLSKQKRKQKVKNFSTFYFRFWHRTRDRGRTDTGLHPLVFETSASTNSATRAFFCRFRQIKYLKSGCEGTLLFCVHKNISVSIKIYFIQTPALFYCKYLSFKYLNLFLMPYCLPNCSDNLILSSHFLFVHLHPRSGWPLESLSSHGIESKIILWNLLCLFGGKNCCCLWSSIGGCNGKPFQRWRVFAFF